MLKLSPRGWAKPGQRQGKMIPALLPNVKALSPDFEGILTVPLIALAATTVPQVLSTTQAGFIPFRGLGLAGPLGSSEPDR